MRKFFTILFISIALGVGLISGFLIAKSEAANGSIFWNGTANGMVTSTGAVIQPSIYEIRVTPGSVGEDYYPNGFIFDLKTLNVGQTTNLVLYVRNGTKQKANVYPVIISTPNLEVQSLLGNANLYPNGWGQFTFQIKALNIGPCSLNIRFIKSE